MTTLVMSATLAPTMRVSVVRANAGSRLPLKRNLAIALSFFGFEITSIAESREWRALAASLTLGFRVRGPDPATVHVIRRLHPNPGCTCTAFRKRRVVTHHGKTTKYVCWERPPTKGREAARYPFCNHLETAPLPDAA